MKNATLRVLLPLAGMAMAAAAGAADETPEAVLARKGLVRDGVRLVLNDAAARDATFNRIAEEVPRVRAQLEPLRAERDRLQQEVNRAKDRESHAQDEEDVDEVVGRDPKTNQEIRERHRRYTGAKARAKRDVERAEAALSDFKGRTDKPASDLERELTRLNHQAIELRQETLLLYQSHSADPEVRGAIRTLNRTRQPRLVLGPIASAAEYQMRLNADDLQLLREKGIVPFADRRNPRRLVLMVEHEVVALHIEAQRLEKALSVAESGGPTGSRSKFADLLQRRAKAADELARDDGQRRVQLQALLDVLDGQIRRLPPEATDMDAAAQAAAAKLAAARTDYDQALSNLRHAADAALEARPVAEADLDVRAALLHLGGLKIARLVEYQQALDYLAKADPIFQAAPTAVGRTPESSPSRSPSDRLVRQ
jgi:hypothetical protein